MSSSGQPTLVEIKEYLRESRIIFTLEDLPQFAHRFPQLWPQCPIPLQDTWRTDPRPFLSPLAKIQIVNKVVEQAIIALRSHYDNLALSELPPSIMSTIRKNLDSCIDPALYGDKFEFDRTIAYQRYLDNPDCASLVWPGPTHIPKHTKSSKLQSPEKDQPSPRYVSTMRRNDMDRPRRFQASQRSEPPPLKPMSTPSPPYHAVFPSLGESSRSSQRPSVPRKARTGESILQMIEPSSSAAPLTPENLAALTSTSPPSFHRPTYSSVAAESIPPYSGEGSQLSEGVRLPQEEYETSFPYSPTSSHPRRLLPGAQQRLKQQGLAGLTRKDYEEAKYSPPLDPEPTSRHPLTRPFDDDDFSEKWPNSQLDPLSVSHDALPNRAIPLPPLTRKQKHASSDLAIVKPPSVLARTTTFTKPTTSSLLKGKFPAMSGPPRSPQCDCPFSHSKSRMSCPLNQ